MALPERLINIESREVYFISTISEDNMPSRVIYNIYTLKGDFVCSVDTITNETKVDVDGMRRFTQSSFNFKDGWNYGWK